MPVNTGVTQMLEVTAFGDTASHTQEEVANIYVITAYGTETELLFDFLYINMYSRSTLR